MRIRLCSYIYIYIIFSEVFHDRADASNDTKDPEEVARYAENGAMKAVMPKDDKKSLANLAYAAAIDP